MQTQAHRHARAVLVLDFDGVLRIWPGGDDLRLQVERLAGLTVGSLDAELYQGAAYERLIQGQLNACQWRQDVRHRLGDAAAQLWFERPMFLDQQVLAVLRGERRAGRRVVLLSNASDELEADLLALGVSDLFDRVYNSSRLGLRKPAPAIYEAVERGEQRDGRGLLLVDDLAENVVGARARGWLTCRYRQVDDLLDALAEADGSLVAGTPRHGRPSKPPANEERG